MGILLVFRLGRTKIFQANVNVASRAVPTSLRWQIVMDEITGCQVLFHNAIFISLQYMFRF
jgi:hypothetical protein